MSLPTEILEYGTSNSPLVNEPSGTPAFLVDTLTINITRDEALYQNVNGSTTRAKYTNPIGTFEFDGKISLVSGVCNQHPGTLVSSLANFTSTVNGMDPEEGVLVFLDPSRTLSEEEDFVGYSFTVKHLPFVESA